MRRDVVAKLQLCCAQPTSLNERRLLGWEVREHVPCPLHRDALCAHFGVGSIAELGLGYTEESAYNWTLATKAERKAEVHRRKLLEKGVKVAVVPLLPGRPAGRVGAAAWRPAQFRLGRCGCG